jgi:YesN/AraC family two-component response regulator
MEKFKTFKDLAEEIGGTITPWEPGEEFLRDFEEYMKESIRQSRINEAKALESAKNIIIF